MKVKLLKEKNNSILFLSSVLCLLPIILSFVLYNELPVQIAIHWDSAGKPDNYLPKAAAAFGLPVLFAAINIFSKIRLFNDPKRAYTSVIMQRLVTWLIPLMSLVLVPVTLYISMGVRIPIFTIIPVFTGVVLIVAGNYLPKSRQNYTIGIKLPWTLSDADNWNKTHRFAGYLYIFFGIALIVVTFAFIDTAIWGGLAIAALALLLVLPALYSLALYKKSCDSSRNTND